MVSRQLRRGDFEKANTIAARVILGDIERFGGESAGLVQWARAFTRKAERRPDVSEHRQGDLFRAA